MFYRHGRFLSMTDARSGDVPGHVMGRPGRPVDFAAAAIRLRRGIARRAAGVVLVAGSSSLPAAKVAPAIQVGHYPSYYPDEIRIDVIDPAAAAKGLSDETLHAYVGAAPGFAGPVPEHVKSVQSLGSFLVLSFNTASRALRFRRGSLRCRRAASSATLSEEKARLASFSIPIR